MNIFSKLGWFFKQEKKRYIIGITFLALTSLANLIPPRVLGLMADQLDKGHVSWSEYAALIIAVLAAAFTLYILDYFWRKQIWGGAAELERQNHCVFPHIREIPRETYLVESAV